MTDANTNASTLPRVLLLGDSIRMSYQAHVAAVLADEAAVVGPGDNCRFALYTNMRLQSWLAELDQPNFVHWNNGIWDCGFNPTRGPKQFSVDDYMTNIKTIYNQLKATGATIIWGTITPVHPDHPGDPDGWTWKNETIDAFNAAASEFMLSEGVAINDLHALVKPDPVGLLAEDKLHLSSAGVERCGNAVASALRLAMKK